MTGTRLYTALQQIVSSLTSRVPFALVGGLAVSARAEPRFTRDVDLAVAAATDAEAEDLVRQLRAGGYGVLALVEHEAASRLATVRLTPPATRAGGVVLDLLFASSGIEPEIVAVAERLTIAEDLTLPVAATGHLIATKVLSVDGRRLQDRLDLEALVAVATEEDLNVARDALSLIGSRGFDRGKALQEDLRRLLAELNAPNL